MQEFYIIQRYSKDRTHKNTVSLWVICRRIFSAALCEQYKDNVSKVIISYAGTTRLKTTLTSVAILEDFAFLSAHYSHFVSEIC